jgi:hypothetical protein
MEVIIMNAVRERVMENMKPYLDFAKHKDLIAITIGADYFNYDSEADVELEADFGEVVVAVEKDWLFATMLAEGIEEPLYYLQNEYTWDDSFVWFEDAKTSGKVAVVEFN